MQPHQLGQNSLLHPAACCCTFLGMDTTTDSPMKVARLEKGWTLRKLAAVLAAAGVSASDGNLSRIERGEVAPGPALRRALRDTLNLTDDQLPQSRP